VARKSPKRSPTMYDVASHAGVSQTTVSLVLNDVANHGIPEETIQRIWAAVKELGYRPNALAKGLASNRSNQIGFITDSIATTPLAGKIIEGAQEAAWSQGKLLLLVNIQDRSDVTQAAIELMLAQQVEGIIYATMYHRSVQLPDIFHQVPTVLLDCYVEDRSLPSVVPDEIAGGRSATEVLLQNGHRRIGFLNHVAPVPATFGRLEGYKRALADYGVAFDQALAQTGEDIASGGYDATLALMRLPERPTALFCYNDRMAMGAYDALRKLGLRIPEDVSVIGFDNQELITVHLYPGLSTMALPHYEMGHWAANYLLDHGVGTAAGTALQHMLECRYIERGSVAGLRSQR
jgi:LacI family transcriptional regulator